MADDAAAVVLSLEVRVGEAHEYLVHLVPPEEIGQVPHAVGSNDGSNVDGEILYGAALDTWQGKIEHEL